MARNFKEAVGELAKDIDRSAEFIIDGELVVEVEAEDDDTIFDVYEDEYGNKVKAGTPVGVEVTDGLSEMFIMYDQYTVVG